MYQSLEDEVEKWFFVNLENKYIFTYFIFNQETFFVERIVG